MSIMLPQRSQVKLLLSILQASITGSVSSSTGTRKSYQSPPHLPALSTSDEENLPETPLFQKASPSGTKAMDISIVNQVHS